MIRAIVAAALLAAAVPAAAQLSPAIVTVGPSGRWGAVDVGMQRYRPNLDAEFTASPPADRPYQKYFGTSDGWMLHLGFSRALFTKVGSLEIGVRSGWFQDSGTGFKEGTLEPSSETTRFRMIPTSLALSYRFDWATERYKIPFAPYARLALERYNWWITDGSGSTSEKGATNGWSWTAGVAFLLDFLDPTLAREFDRDSGVNHTYLTFDVSKSYVDDFGSSTSWDLSNEDLSFALGLLFVF
ncbi:MAG TPA: MXAN_2562 family outer membrane beta-barrel protein [Anaeromyxobacter sp.]|nr:MXAN_2562 family outer membrane beta-barrel protein [Anaeromyxobacter sp.]